MPTKLGNLSRAISRATGGEPGQTLCARVAERFGADCRFCSWIGRFTAPNHCAEELARWQRRGTSIAVRLRENT